MIEQTVETNNEQFTNPLQGESWQVDEQLRFDFHPRLPIMVRSSAHQITSDAGLLPIRQFDARWRYTERMAACLEDPASRRKHSLDENLRQRIFGIIADYEDCNDHDTLRDDPIFKIIADRLPDDDALASQPTLSRFENIPTPKVLFKLIDFHIATGVERLKQHHKAKAPAKIILDIDATDDPTHGNQQLTMFHGYYDQYQYLPLIISEPTSKHVFLAQLRHGTAHPMLGATDDLTKVINAIRKEYPQVVIEVRGDAGFGHKDMLEFCEAPPQHPTVPLLYTLGFSSNARLKKITEPLMNQAVERYEATREKQRLFMTFPYQCDTWDKPRQLIAKAECGREGTNLRFIVTNHADIQTSEDAMRCYDAYILRGESEHRMDELKNGLKMDRLSCHRFMANFFRLLMHVAAMNLLNAQRDSLTLPEIIRKGQPCTWRTHIIKVAATVKRSVRRVLVELASNWPWWHIYQSAAMRSNGFFSSA